MNQNTTIVFPLPMEIMKALGPIGGGAGDVSVDGLST